MSTQEACFWVKKCFEKMGIDSKEFEWTQYVSGKGYVAVEFHATMWNSFNHEIRKLFKTNSHNDVYSSVVNKYNLDITDFNLLGSGACPESYPKNLAILFRELYKMLCEVEK